MFTLPQGADIPVENEVVSIEGVRGVVKMREMAAAVEAHRRRDPELKPGDRIETCFEDGAWFPGEVLEISHRDLQTDFGKFSLFQSKKIGNFLDCLANSSKRLETF